MKLKLFLLFGLFVSCSQLMPAATVSSDSSSESKVEADAVKDIHPHKLSAEQLSKYLEQHREMRGNFEELVKNAGGLKKLGKIKCLNPDAKYNAVLYLVDFNKNFSEVEVLYIVKRGVDLFKHLVVYPYTGIVSKDNRQKLLQSFVRKHQIDLFESWYKFESLTNDLSLSKSRHNELCNRYSKRHRDMLKRMDVFIETDKLTPIESLSESVQRSIDYFSLENLYKTIGIGCDIKKQGPSDGKNLYTVSLNFALELENLIIDYPFQFEELSEKNYEDFENDIKKRIVLNLYKAWEQWELKESDKAKSRIQEHVVKVGDKDKAELKEEVSHSSAASSSSSISPNAEVSATLAEEPYKKTYYLAKHNARRNRIAEIVNSMGGIGKVPHVRLNDKDLKGLYNTVLLEVSTFATSETSSKVVATYVVENQHNIYRYKVEYRYEVAVERLSKHLNEMLSDLQNSLCKQWYEYKKMCVKEHEKKKAEFKRLLEKRKAIVFEANPSFLEKLLSTNPNLWRNVIIWDFCLKGKAIIVTYYISFGDKVIYKYESEEVPAADLTNPKYYENEIDKIKEFLFSKWDEADFLKTLPKKDLLAAENKKNKERLNTLVTKEKESNKRELSDIFTPKLIDKMTAKKCAERHAKLLEKVKAAQKAGNLIDLATSELSKEMMEYQFSLDGIYNTIIDDVQIKTEKEHISVNVIYVIQIGDKFYKYDIKTFAPQGLSEESIRQILRNNLFNKWSKFELKNPSYVESDSKAESKAPTSVSRVESAAQAAAAGAQEHFAKHAIKAAIIEYKKIKAQKGAEQEQIQLIQEQIQDIEKIIKKMRLKRDVAVQIWDVIKPPS